MTTPISASRLQHIEDGIEDISDDIYTGTAWTAFTPTVTNVSLTGATMLAYYYRVGKTCIVSVQIVLGTAAPVSGSIILSTPFTARSSGRTGGITPLGTATLRDNSPAASYNAGVLYFSTTSVTIRFVDPTGGTITYAQTSATAPFTWASGDSIHVQYTMEIA